MAAVVVCPICRCGNLVVQPKELCCEKCNRSFPRGGDFFYDLATVSATQERSLLIHEFPTANPDMTRWGWAKNAVRLRKCLSTIKPSVVLDMGCGNGGFYSTLAGLYDYYHGFEPSPVPQERVLPTAPPPNVFLMHNAPSSPLPVSDSSVDVAMFLASYDHIPNRGEVVSDTWRCLKPGGHLLINMTNYGFWAKQLACFVAGRRVFTQAHEHFCVHDPDSLVAEIKNTVGVIAECMYEADYSFVPNLRVPVLYRSSTVLAGANATLRFLIHVCLRQSNVGSPMIVAVRKPV